MFAAVYLENIRHLKFKVKKGIYFKNNTEFVLYIAPCPKNQKEKEILIQKTKEHWGKIIFPKYLENEKEFAKISFKGENFVKRVLAEAFLTYIKSFPQKEIAIFDNLFLKKEYFAEISKYTNNLAVIGKSFKEDIKQYILKETGMVLTDKINENNSLCLNLTKENSFPCCLNSAFTQDALEKTCQSLIKEYLDFGNIFSAVNFFALCFYEEKQTNIFEKTVKRFLKDNENLNGLQTAN